MSTMTKSKLACAMSRMRPMSSGDDHLQRQHVGGGGQDMQLVVEGQHRLDQAVAVHDRRCRSGFPARLPCGAGPDRSRPSRTAGQGRCTQTRIASAVGDQAQFPGQVGGEGRWRPTPPAMPCTGRITPLRSPLGLKTPVKGAGLAGHSLRGMTGLGLRSRSIASCSAPSGSG